MDIFIEKRVKLDFEDTFILTSLEFEIQKELTNEKENSVFQNYALFDAYQKIVSKMKTIMYKESEPKSININFRLNEFYSIYRLISVNRLDKSDNLMLLFYIKMSAIIVNLK